MSDFHDMDTKSGFPQTALEDRLISRFYSPGSIKGASLAIVESNWTALTQSASVATGASVTFIVGSVTTYEHYMIGDLDCTLYVGSVARANELPGGASITWSDYIVNGPINTPFDVNSVQYPEISNYTTRIQVLNDSGSTRTIILVSKLRYIADAGDYVE